jgi:c-di-GMP-related signal transduction protein
MSWFKKAPPPIPVQKVEKVMPENPYLGREPIINREQAIMGYDLFFRPGVTLKAKRINERNEALAEIAAQLASDPKAVVTYPDEVTDANLRDDEGNEVKEAALSEIIHSLKNQGITQSLGQHLGFIKIHLGQLGDELRGVPAMKFPLQISLIEILDAIQAEAAQAVENTEVAETPTKKPDELTVAKLPAILERLEKLRIARYQLVLTGLTEMVDGLKDILPRFRYVKLDLNKTTDAASLIEFCKSIPLPIDPKAKAKKDDNSSNLIQIIASEVHTPEDFHKAFDLGCDLFEGFYFIKPDPELSLHRGDDFKNILKLLTLLLSSPELHELVDEIESNRVVAKYLMDLAEADSKDNRKKPENLQEATVFAGVKRITRWTQLLLYADSKAKIPLESTPLLQLVCTRAFFMESASEKLPSGVGLGSADLAFMVGCLSLIDNVFDEPSRDLLSKFNLPHVVVDAVADRSGLLGSLLALSEAAEVGDLEKCQQLCSGELGALTLKDVAQDSLAAITAFVALTQLAPTEDVWELAAETEEAEETEEQK